MYCFFANFLYVNKMSKKERENLYCINYGDMALTGIRMHSDFIKTIDCKSCGTVFQINGNKDGYIELGIDVYKTAGDSGLLWQKNEQYGFLPIPVCPFCSGSKKLKASNKDDEQMSCQVCNTMFILNTNLTA